MDFAHYQSPLLLGSSGNYLIYRQNLGRSAKSKIPDRLGFSQHMKTRFNALYVLLH